MKKNIKVKPADQSPVVVIYGAGGDLGSAAARTLSRKGARLVLVSRSLEKLKKAAEFMAPDRVLLIPADATLNREVARSLRLAQKRFGRVYAVVISTGRWDQLTIKDSAKTAEDLFSKHMREVAKTAFTIALAAKDFFREQKQGGWILNFSSHAATNAKLEGNLSYALVKAGVHQFMLNLGEELRAAGLGRIQVSNLVIGLVNSPGNKKWFKKEADKSKAVQPDDIGGMIWRHLGAKEVPVELELKSKFTAKVK